MAFIFLTMARLWSAIDLAGPSLPLQDRQPR